MNDSSKPAIRADGLSKTFRVYLRPSDVVRDLFARESRAVERRALQDVTFEVQRGEVVGILGRNGAGKSTLLKIIAGTLDRSGGELQVNGRITAILELGTGFHPEYSGRENIRLGGLCLGMSLDEIRRKIDGIIDFSELASVIDQPFRTYSTGMQARLTFATAISVDPDILVIDEALSVGDARFQMKCFARMAELRQRGHTILLVSHDTNTITTFCNRAIVLEDGKVFAQGAARDMSAAYLRLLFGERPGAAGAGEIACEAPAAAPVTPVPEAPVSSDHGPPGRAGGERALADVAGDLADRSTAAPSTGDVRQASEIPPSAAGHVRFGDGSMAVLSFGLCDPSGREMRLVESGSKCTFHMRAQCLRAIDRLSCGFAIKDRRGTVVFGVTNVARNEPIEDVRPGEIIDVSTEMTMWLAAGDYFINLGFGHLAVGEMCDFFQDGIQFTVFGPGGIFTTAVVNLEADFRFARGFSTGSVSPRAES